MRKNNIENRNFISDENLWDYNEWQDLESKVSKKILASKDQEEAFKWYQKAADQGNLWAKEILKTDWWQVMQVVLQNRQEVEGETEGVERTRAFFIRIILRVLWRRALR